MNENIIGRAVLLIQQKRYADAEKLLKDLLASEPNDATILLLLSEVNLQQGNLDNAITIINNAISISPDMANLFYLKGRILLNKNQIDEAEKNIIHALELNPADADFYALLASIKMTRKQFESALEYANKALKLDSENILGLNMRSNALLKLDHKDDAFTTIEGALREDPNNAYTHANYGWGLLEKGDHKKALVHFRESLKNDPNFDYARTGMMEAMKANNIFYKVFLKYSFWINNLTAKYQWATIIGFYFGTRLLKSFASSNPTLQPYLNPLIFLLAFIAFSTWVITPISNLFLRFNVYGKHLLSKNEIISSNFVGISFLIFLLGVFSYLIVKEDKYLAIAVFGFAMMVPFSSMLSPTKYKYSLIIYAVVMAFIGLGAIFVTFTTGVLFNTLSTTFLLGFVVFQWVVNFLLIKQSNA